MTQMRFELNEQTARVLDVIKGKYGLKNRTDALKQFVKLHGDAYVAPTVNEAVLRELDATYAQTQKRGHKKMSLNALQSHLGLK